MRLNIYANHHSQLMLIRYCWISLIILGNSPTSKDHDMSVGQNHGTASAHILEMTKRGTFRGMCTLPAMMLWMIGYDPYTYPDHS